MTETIQVDDPQPGFFVLRSFGREVPAMIYREDDELIGMVAGKACDAHSVWNYHRRRIDEAEYHRMMAAPAPIVPNVEKLPAYLEVADKWRSTPICDEAGAGRATDLRKILSECAKTLSGRAKAETAPLRAQILDITASYKERLDKIQAAEDMLRGKLSEWMIAEKKRLAAEAASRLPATVDGSDATLPVVHETPVVQVRGNQAGRASSLRAYYTAIVSDFDAAIATFRNHPDLIAVLNKLGSARAREMKGAPIAGFSVTKEERASL